MAQAYMQSNLTGGEVSPTLHSRVDMDRYSTAVAEATNVIIVPQGGLRRRPGLKKLLDGHIGEECRMTSFVFNKTQKYLIVFRVNNIGIYKDGELIATVAATQFSSLDIIRDLDMVQAGDTVIITHGSIAPLKLVRGAVETSWTLSAISLTIPTFDFGSGAEPVWSASRGYPFSCTFHMGRLWFGGSTSKPTSVWGSRIQGFFDFTWVEDASGGIPDDHAIFDTIESDEYNVITNIYSARGLQVFTTGAEFFNTEPIITPARSSWRAQTGYGAKKGIRPIFIDGATLFVDSSERNIREFLYNYEEDAHVSNSITLLASHLLTNIISMSAIKGTNVDVSDYLYVINEDGTAVVMNTLRSEKILGWTKWETDGEFKDVCVVDKDVYFLVKREGSYFIEKIEEGTYTDNNVVLNGVEPTVSNITYIQDNIVFNGNNITFTDYASGTPATSIDTDYPVEFNNKYFKVIADYSMQADAQPIETSPGFNYFEVDRDAYRIEVGLDFSTKVVTLPLHTSYKSVTSFYKPKRVVKVDIDVYESLGVYARDIYSGDRKFTIALDSAPQPFTGSRELYLLGYNKRTQIEITQENPLPMLIRAIGYELEV